MTDATGQAEPGYPTSRDKRGAAQGGTRGTGQDALAGPKGAITTNITRTVTGPPRQTGSPGPADRGQMLGGYVRNQPDVSAQVADGNMAADGHRRLREIAAPPNPADPDGPDAPISGPSRNSDQYD